MLFLVYCRPRTQSRVKTHAAPRVWGFGMSGRYCPWTRQCVRNWHSNANACIWHYKPRGQTVSTLYYTDMVETDCASVRPTANQPRLDGLAAFRSSKKCHPDGSCQSAATSEIVKRCKDCKVLCSTSHSRRPGMDHRALPANYTNVCLYLVSVHQMAPPQTEIADI